MKTRSVLRDLRTRNRHGFIELCPYPGGDETERKGRTPTSGTTLRSTAERRPVTSDVGIRALTKQYTATTIENRRESTDIDTRHSASCSARCLLADVHDLASEITSRAAEIEAGRRIPPDLVKALRSIGVFRMLVPRSHGGLELDLPAALEVVGALARIEGSVGWTVAIGCGGNIFTSLLPRHTYDEIYRNGPDVIIVGSSQPVGTADVTAGSWRVNGRWPFASGCEHADWMVGVCMVTEGGKPLADAAQSPIARAFVLPVRDWLIEDTWYVAGLKGTGSHHIVLRDKQVPA